MQKFLLLEEETVHYTGDSWSNSTPKFGKRKLCAWFVPHSFMDE
jgi:hypothetical protein